jgi:catechol-2,3-dioxygenase
MAVGPVGQIHISVSDVERSVSFYRDVLGIAHLFTVEGTPK